MDQKQLEIKKKEVHLSNERTLLSYIRTAMSVLVLAAALFKFFADSFAKSMGIICLVAGFFILGLGFYRFFAEGKRIRSGEFFEE